MTSLILRTATGFLKPVLLVFSVLVLFRGHNEPGGGFVGGLVAASAFALETISYGVAKARKALGIEPHIFIGVGLIVAVASGIISLTLGLPLMTTRWFRLSLPMEVYIEAGTSLLFDIGVYFVVMGATLMVIFALSKGPK